MTTAQCSVVNVLGLHARAAARFPSIMDSSTGLSPLSDLTPFGIIEDLQLARPIYAPTAAYGHFGRAHEDGFFPWESTVRAQAKVSVPA